MTEKEQENYDARVQALNLAHEFVMCKTDPLSDLRLISERCNKIVEVAKLFHKYIAKGE